MAANMNKVFLAGNLTRDPEIRYTPGGAAVCQMGMAINRTFEGKDGKKQEEVCFVDVTAWGKTAENCNTYLRKGSSVLVEGRLKFDSWEDRETKQKRSKLDVVAERVQFLDGKGGSGASDSDSSDSRREPPRERATANPPQGRGYTAKDAGTPGGVGDDADDDGKLDIPFRFNDFDTTSEGVR